MAEPDWNTPTHPAWIEIIQIGPRLEQSSHIALIKAGPVNDQLIKSQLNLKYSQCHTHILMCWPICLLFGSYSMYLMVPVDAKDGIFFFPPNWHQIPNIMWSYFPGDPFYSRLPGWFSGKHTQVIFPSLLRTTHWFITQRVNLTLKEDFTLIFNNLLDGYFF